MRKSRQETAESRRRIVQAAARLYREKGFEGVAVQDVMQAAGMTHGGFYRHFPSKEALIAAAMTDAFEDRIPPVAVEGDPADVALLRQYVDLYLSGDHLDHPALGCPVAAVGSEAPHLGGEVSRTFHEGMERMVRRLAVAFPGTEEQRRAEALRVLASLVGAVVIARAVGSSSSLRDDVLAAVRNDEEVSRLMKEPAA